MPSVCRKACLASISTARALHASWASFQVTTLCQHDVCAFLSCRARETCCQTSRPRHFAMTSGDGCWAGTSYGEFIRSMHLPQQLAQVDPIVASFCGGAVGVLSTLMVVEARPSVWNLRVMPAALASYCERQRLLADVLDTLQSLGAGKQRQGSGGATMCLLRRACPPTLLLDFALRVWLSPGMVLSVQKAMCVVPLSLWRLDGRALGTSRAGPAGVWAQHRLPRQ